MPFFIKKTLKELYNIIPFKKELFSFIKLFWQPKENLYKHLHFRGVFNVEIDQKKSFNIRHHGYQIENEIFWAGIENGWEKESIKLWIHLCEKSNTIFDIGANTGIYALIAKAINSNSKVYAFEPVDSVYKKLLDNVTLNSFDIVCEKKAISNDNGTASIFLVNPEHTLSVTVNKDLSPTGVKTTEMKIETIKLDTYIKQNSIENIDLIKIDVETHEPEVLEGFSNYFSKFKPTLIIEVLSDQIGAEIEKKVKDLGYLYFNIDERKGIRQVKHITKSDYYNYLLCNEKVAKELGLVFKQSHQRTI